MVLIEFFDKEPMDNMIGCLSVQPQKVFLLGSNVKRIKKQLPKYSDFLSRRGIEAQFKVKTVPKNNLKVIIEVLVSIVEGEEGCCFDLTGGDDLTLVAVGVIYQRFRQTKNLVLHRYNVRTHSVVLCENEEGCEMSLERATPSVTVEESIALHGGAVPSTFVGTNRVESWEYSQEFMNDIETMWNISKKLPSEWNSATGVLASFEATRTAGTPPLSVAADISRRKNMAQVISILEKLCHADLVSNLNLNNNTLSFRYKNQQIRRCLTKAGNVLELKTIITARRLKNDDGSDYYTDSAVQVCIDWDGNLNAKGTGTKDTENEIDVVLMRNLVPVFISCKNGAVDDEELYKLNTVAQRFGGSYVKKVLVATHLGKKGEAARHFRQRAADMDIYLIDNVHLIKEETFERSLRNIVV